MTSYRILGHVRSDSHTSPHYNTFVTVFLALKETKYSVQSPLDTQVRIPTDE